MNTRSVNGPSLSTQPVKSQRRWDIDWLRVLATLTIFLFHCARFFDSLGWHIKNAQRSTFLTLFVVLLALWEMPLFFLLSGVGSWYALKSRNAGGYLFERVKRLLIPFYTVGIFIILPPQFYFDRVTHVGRSSPIWKLIPPYFAGSSFRFYFDAPYLTNLWPGHLWFLQFLFNVSLLTLPLLFFLRSERGRRLVQRLAEWSARRGGIFLFLIPLVLARIGLRSFFRGEHTWADLVEYAIFFLIGYLIPADKRFTEGFKRHGWLCLALGMAGFVGVSYMFTELRYNPMDGETFSQTYVLFQVVGSVGSWSWLVFILSLGAKYLNFNHKVLAYGNGMVLPFYILHQTVILVVGWYIIPLEWSILLKYLVISTSSFVLIVAIYEVLIKRINPIRFLFGMRLRKRKAKSV